MSANNSNSTLFDEFFEGLTRHPSTVFILGLLIAGLCFSTAAILLAIVFFVIIRPFPKAIISVGILGGLLLLVSLLCHVGLPDVHAWNHLFYQAIWQQDLSFLRSPFLWLSALPYGLLFSAGFAGLWQITSPLKKELRRLGKGKANTPFRSASPRRLQKALCSVPSYTRDSNTVLGVNRETACCVVLDDADANLHTLAVGTTGSGKTTAIANLVESAICRGLPVCYVDGKGDLSLAEAIKAFSKLQGVPFYLFSMVGESLAYNPLASGGFTAKKDRIIELREWSEDHYRKIAEGYLQTVFRLLAEANINVDLHTLSQYLEPAPWYTLARSLKKADWIPFIERLEKQHKSIESLIAEIQNMAESEIGPLFQCHDKENVITLEHVLAQNGVVYFCLQPLAFPSYATTLGKLVINDLKALLATKLNTSSSKKLLAIFDEFSIFVGDQIVNVINQGRGAGLQAVLATQSLSDIQRKGGDALLGQVLNNVNNYLIQRQNYPGDAEMLANVIGTRDVFVVTSRVSQDQGGMGSVRESKGFYVHPDEIKRLGLGEGIFVNKQRFQIQRILVRQGAIDF